MAGHSGSIRQLDQYNLQGEKAEDPTKLLKASSTYRLLKTHHCDQANMFQPLRYPEGDQAAENERLLDPATDSEASSTYRRIGAGHCGSVWTSDATPLVLKRGDGAETRYLWKEYYMQTRLLEALARIPGLKSGVNVPYCYWYTNESDIQWWSKQLAHFPAELRGGVTLTQQASNAMCSERIPPIGKEMRETLIEKYCSERLKTEIKKDAKNKDCIVRLYLGRRRTHARGSMFFSLRNFPLWLDQALDLDLPILQYVEMMAESLAVMHWEAELDAGDVEFVLGAPRSAPRAELLPSSTIAQLPYDSRTRWRDPQLHAYEFQREVKTTTTAPVLWVLDFDCCGLITTDAHGVEKAASAFYRNDPYFPRPCGPGGPDFEVWEVFRKSYVKSSRPILERKGLDIGLADMFIKRLIIKQGEPKEIRNAPFIEENGGHDSTFYKAFLGVKA